MKGIVVTKKNYKFVTSKLKKFFDHKSFIVWHDFNCGMKKRIGHILNTLNIKGYDTMSEYNNIYTRKSDVSDLMIVEMNYEESFLVEFGNEVWFLGNRVIIKSYHSCLNKMLYQCFQINK